MLPSADKLYGDADFIFQQDLAPAHTAKGTKSWFNDHGVTVLDWPANSPDLNPIENLWGIVKRKMRDTRPNNADELKATVIYLIHKFHNLSWITEINELFHDILIYWDAPVCPKWLLMFMTLPYRLNDCVSFRTTFCPYALYRELIIAINHAFSFRLLCFVKQTPLQTHRCNFVHSWSGLLY